MDKITLESIVPVNPALVLNLNKDGRNAEQSFTISTERLLEIVLESKKYRKVLGIPEDLPSGEFIYWQLSIASRLVKSPEELAVMAFQMGTFMALDDSKRDAKDSLVAAIANLLRKEENNG